MNGFLFPGQGSQAVGMGRRLYEDLPQAKVMLDTAGDILGYNLKHLMFEGPQEQLTATQYAQPAIYTCSAMYLEKGKAEGLECDYAAGHSLGEYNALLAAGVFSFAEGLRLVEKRSAVMSQMNGKGIMAAVIGLSEKELKPYLTPGVVMANLNAKTQIVISGEEAEVETVGRKLKEDGAAGFKRLHVSAAFHSPQMEEAAKAMQSVIESTDFRFPSCYVISNVTGRPTKDLAEIKANLTAQITGQVRWYDTILSMKAAGVSALYEVGHGDVLKKISKTITFRPKCYGVEP